MLGVSLRQAGYNVRNASSAAVAMMTIAADRPDLVLLDVRMPDLDGFTLCRYLNSAAITADIPIIFMSALADVPDKLKAFAVGGADYITKPFEMAEVLARIEHQLELKRLRQSLKHQNQKLRIVLRQYEIAETQIHEFNQELERRVLEQTQELRSANQILQQEILERRQTEAKLVYLAMYDSLTGLPNRTLLIEHLEKTVQTSQSALYDWSALLMLDCDRFKAINDTLGHLRGDQLLSKIAKRIAAIAPEDAFVARLGDDKFAIMLPILSDIGAIAPLVQRLQTRFAEPIELGSYEVTITANVGIVLVDPSYCQAEQIGRAHV